MKSIRSLFFIIAAALFVPGLALAAPPQPPTSHQSNQLAFHDAMRKLWEDHITWTRLFIVSDIQGLPDLQATTDRLLQNQVEIGDAIRPYYGDEAGDQLTSLLTDHILVAAAIANALKAQDTATVQAQTTAWYANANDIAAFLNGLNPDNWSLEDMQAMMKSHLDLTTNELVDYYNGDYAASVSDYEDVHVEILMMADMLSDGIEAQFPQAFAPGQG